MKKSIYVLLAVLPVVGISAFIMPGDEPTPSPARIHGPVVFADPVLETMVRGTMGKPEGDISISEAETVIELNLSFQSRQYLPEEIPIKDIGGLESFANLESLDLSFHAITDITPLSGLKKLTSLSLSGNPADDISPLAGLTNLKELALSNCAAQDYSPLAKLGNLNLLILDHAAITDVSPLASLTHLKHLFLADSSANDYSPLKDIYPNLEKKDFIIAFMLAEHGFIT